MPRSLSNRSQEPLATPTPPGEKPTYRHLGQVVGAAMRALVKEEWDDAASLPDPNQTFTTSKEDNDG